MTTQSRMTEALRRSLTHPTPAQSAYIAARSAFERDGSALALETVKRAWNAMDADERGAVDLVLEQALQVREWAA